MRFGSVCSGIEAASVAWGHIGWNPAWFSEIEPFPCAVLAHRYPDVHNWGDMASLPGLIESGVVESPDIFCGGTPCQAFSVAGQRRSLDDARGNLSLVFCEIANAIDDVRRSAGKPPAIVFWENVPGVLSTKDNAFGCFLSGLAGGGSPVEPAGGKWTNAGCIYGPKRTVAWRVLDAQYFGVAQRRRRVFVVASSRTDIDPAAILFEFDGLRRDFAPRRKAREVAPTIPSRSTAGGGLGTDFDLDGGVITMAHGQGGAEIGFDRGPTLTCNHEAPIAAYSFPGNWIGRKPENGPNQMTPSVEISPCLNTIDRHGVAHPIPFDTTQITSLQNGSNPKSGDPCHPLAAGAHAPAIAFDCKSSGQNGFGVGDIAGTMRSMCHSRSHANGGGHLAVAQPVGAFFAGNGSKAGSIAYDENVSPTLKASDSGTNRTPSAHVGMAVRRLTPVECERLQGFPDGYTQIPWRNKPSSECPDGPRYKALGNSWAVPVVRWIGKRIALAVAIANDQRGAV